MLWGRASIELRGGLSESCGARQHDENKRRQNVGSDLVEGWSRHFNTPVEYRRLRDPEPMARLLTQLPASACPALVTGKRLGLTPPANVRANGHGLVARYRQSQVRDRLNAPPTRHSAHQPDLR